MLYLYSGSDITDISFLGQALEPSEWQELKKRVSQLLLARSKKPISQLFDEMQFDLCWATNHLNHEFMVLRAELPIERYVKLGDLDPVRRAAYLEVANTLSSYGAPVRFIVAVPSTSETIQGVGAPIPVITSAIVERALHDAETLMRASGPSSAVDRVHTALHGYLKAHCDRAGIPTPEKAGVTELFRLLRNTHPRFGAGGTRRAEVDRILRSLAAVTDSVNTIRNEASAAHPNESLLEEPEALLFVNAVRTLLHYLDAKLARGGEGVR